MEQRVLDALWFLKIISITIGYLEKSSYAHKLARETHLLNSSNLLRSSFQQQFFVDPYSYTNNIYIDTKYAFTRRFVATSANIHYDYIWSDTAYLSECSKDLLSLDWFVNRMHENGLGNHHLSAAQTERNFIRSQIYASAEHLFGCFVTSIWGKFLRKICLNGTRVGEA